MKRTVKALGAAALLAMLAGCGGVAGRWTVYQVEPESARGHFELADVRLNRDHTYRVESVYQGRIIVSSGKWKFEDGRLVFSGDDGKSRSYDAKLIDGGAKLEVRSELQGSEVVAILRREG